MKVDVNGVDIKVSENFRDHIEDSLQEMKDKYFDHASNAAVFFAKERHLFKVEVHMNVGRGILLKGTSHDEQLYPAFDSAVERLGRRLSKYKSKLKDHHAREDVATAMQLMATEKTFRNQEDDDDIANDEPVIIAEMEAIIEDITVSEAMMRLELGDLPALMFRDRETQRINMLYRRNDGNIGWVDPKE